jgi:iron complex transport system ATP-binding protein
LNKNFNKTIEQGIVVESLSWHPPKNEKPVLNDLNCLIEKGNIYGIIGPNGSGKTYLVKNLLRFIEAQEGNIILDEIDLRNYKRKDLAKKIALVPQNTALDSSFCTYDIVMMGRIPHQKRFANASEADREMVQKAMQLTDCYQLKDKSVATLSGGESQRVVTARAIAQDTQWLILDEPTSSLDIKHQIELMDSLKKLNEKKDKTIIAVLHDINIAAAYCNRIIMMKDGQIYSNGKTEEVLTEENLNKVYEVDFEILENLRTGKKYYVPCTNDT